MNLSARNNPCPEQVPGPLQENMQRHRENLVTLAANLQSIGLSESQIQKSVSVIADSYQEQWLRAMNLWVR